MAENTLTGLIPDIYEAMDVVSREMTGLIPSVTMNASANRAALNEAIRVSAEPTGNVSDITPEMTVPDPTGQTTGYSDVVITKSRAAEFGFIGEDQMGLNNGSGYLNSRAGKISQAIRSIVNEVESDLAGLQSTFSRAYGTAGTTPFGTANDYTDASQVLKILKDNGAPQSDINLVIDTTAGANFIGKQSAVNSAGTDSMLRQGVLLDLAGMPLRESGQIETTGTNVITGTVTVTALEAVGQTTINMTTAGASGVTALAGDIITFAGDTNKYVIASDVTIGASTTGDVVIAAPGLKLAVAATTAVSGVAASARNMAFARSALVLAARAPARPTEGDNASDVIVVTDDRSGLSLEFSLYPGYRKVRYEVALAWGVKNIKPAHSALLLG
jgi:hypothetical protein